jgi:hypothetical protein
MRRALVFSQTLDEGEKKKRGEERKGEKSSRGETLIQCGFFFEVLGFLCGGFFHLFVRRMLVRGYFFDVLFTT